MTASAFAPFFTNTPAQIPQAVPKESSRTFTLDLGGGAAGHSGGTGGGKFKRGSVSWTLVQ